jgi:ABC-type amino acid transport system permease subunit
MGLRFTPGAALAAVLAYAFTVDVLSQAWMRILAVGLAVAVAAFAVGAIIGFLFGIPRQLQRDGPDPVGGGGLIVNTNLEQISDWLTKIIVGVGLVQIGSLTSGLSSLADDVPLAGHDSDQAFALALIVYALVDGFIVGYVWTRLELSAKLALADAVLRQPPPPPSPLPPPPSSRVGIGGPSTTLGSPPDRE